MEKHAYLIMAHQQFELVKKLLILLDNPHHDFYLHIDAKAEDINKEYFTSCLHYSKVYFVPRIKVYWGDQSQMKAELILLKEAAPKHYHYYHLLSGSDLPLRPSEEIYNFFENNYDKEFVHFNSINPNKKVLDRIAIYHPLQSKVNNTFFRKMNSLCIRTQHLFKVNRLKKVSFKIGYGANWFSITDKLAQFVLSKEDFIHRYFYSGYCADELFLQTIVLNSKFLDNLYLPCTNKDDYHSIQRLVDWSRGSIKNPYVFRMEDFELLKSSEYLFARKFDSKIDSDIISAMFDYLTKLNHKTN